MKSLKPSLPATEARQLLSSFRNALFLVTLLALPELALAQDFSDKACGFLDNVRNLLNLASVAVVTIAIVFAGYQIAFAHKRIADVAPILIGGLLIGAAGQLAKWIMPDNTGDCSAAETDTGGMAMLIDMAHNANQYLHGLGAYVA